MTSPLGFKARVGSALLPIFAEANVMYIPQDSPLVLHLPTSWRPARSQSLPHMLRGGTWLRFERATARTEDERATIVPVTRLRGTYLVFCAQYRHIMFFHHGRLRFERHHLEVDGGGVVDGNAAASRLV